MHHESLSDNLIYDLYHIDIIYLYAFLISLKRSCGRSERRCRPGPTGTASGRISFFLLRPFFKLKLMHDHADMTGEL
jgi:hypothetical protein